MASSQRILVVGPSWVGDMVMAQSLFKSLKQQYPEAEIDVVAPAWSLPVLEKMPEVRRGLALAVGHGEGGLKKRYALGKSLRGQYDRAIVLPRSLKAALVPFFAKVPVRTGFLGEMRYGLINDIRPFDKTLLDQTVKRFVALGQPAGARLTEMALPKPELAVDLSASDTAMERLSLNTDKPAVGFMPGAEFGPAKQWPAEHFAALATKVASEGGQVWIFGSAKDREVANDINTAAGGVCRNLCGETSLAEVVDLVGRVDVAVSNDSGLMHVAAATGRPVVAVYGSSSPEFTPPLTEYADIHWLRLECSPCFDRTCRFGHYRCLREIAPETIYQSCKRFMRDV
ncbi:MAG: lipopolysaccharide heptosyltransferase II [Pseudomonadota bacterium]